ncbi:MAG TPA: hypothetical protein VGO52_13695 [Hyphomonadaceae bacterium]|nr:hypothetical protein [Hyphomonadaceae bacterium]
MANVLLIIHVFGLMLGAAGGFGSVVALGYARPSQKQKGGPIKGIGRVFTGMSFFGLIILWGTGIALIMGATEPYTLNAMFWMKMVFAAVLTATVIGMELIYARRDAQSARLMPALTPLAALTLVLVAVFSVLAFRGVS